MLHQEAKHCWFFDDVTGQVAPFFAITWVMAAERVHFMDSKIHRKLTKIATAIIFFRSGDQKNEDTYISEKN